MVVSATSGSAIGNSYTDGGPGNLGMADCLGIYRDDPTNPLTPELITNRLSDLAGRLNIEEQVLVERIEQTDRALFSTNGDLDAVKAERLLKLVQAILADAAGTANTDSTSMAGDGTISQMPPLAALHSALPFVKTLPTDEESTPTQRITDQDILRYNSQYPPLTSPDFIFSENLLGKVGEVIETVQDDLQQNSGTWFDEKISGNDLDGTFYSYRFLLNAVARNIKDHGLDLVKGQDWKILERDAAHGSVSNELIDVVGDSFRDIISSHYIASGINDYFRSLDRLDKTIICSENQKAYADKVRGHLELKFGTTLSNAEIANKLDESDRTYYYKDCQSIAEILINIVKNPANHKLIEQYKQGDTADLGKSVSNLDKLLNSKLDAMLSQRLKQDSAIRSAQQKTWLRRGITGTLATAVVGGLTWTSGLFTGGAAHKPPTVAVTPSENVPGQRRPDDDRGVPGALARPETPATPAATPNVPPKTVTEVATTPAKQPNVEIERTANGNTLVATSEASEPILKDISLNIFSETVLPGYKLNFSHNFGEATKAEAVRNKIQEYLKTLCAPGYKAPPTERKFTQEILGATKFIYLNVNSITEELLSKATAQAPIAFESMGSGIYTAEFEDGGLCIVFDNTFDPTASALAFRKVIVDPGSLIHAKPVMQ